MQEHEIEEEVIAPEGYELLTPDGYKPVTHAYKSVPLPLWELSTYEFSIQCAAEHIVATEDGLMFVRDVLPGQYINTQNGLQVVEVVKDLNRKENLYDFSIDSEDHLYYTGGILSHNSTCLGGREIMLTEVFPGFKSIYICPHSEQLKTYADRLKEMEQASRFHDNSYKLRKNLYFKEYDNGSSTKLVNVWTTAHHIRGNTADQLCFDEYQNFDASLEDEVLEVQKASDMPLRIYAGTSLTTDTPLESRFAQGSRGAWHIKDPAGGWINTHDPDSFMDCIQPKGLCSPKTGRILDPRNGRYVHESDEMFRAGKISLHVPQIIIPFFTESIIRWSDIYAKKTSGNIKSFLQENMGIATEEGAREITINHLEDICTLRLEEVRKNAKERKYKFVVSGCDWGGSDYVPGSKSKLSYTFHVVLGVKYDGNMDILHMRKYDGMLYDSIAKDILHNHYALNGSVIASDFGVGQLYNNYIRERVKRAGDHMVFCYTGPASAPISIPKAAHMFNQFSLNKTESITALYDAIKRKRILCYEWEHASEGLEMFLNMYRSTSDTPGGSTTFVYHRHGSKADDSLHATNFAFVAARLMLDEPIVDDPALRNDLLTALGGAGIGTGSEENQWIEEMTDWGPISG